MTQPHTLTAGIAVDNPATGEVVGHVEEASAEDVEQAVARAAPLTGRRRVGNIRPHGLRP